MQSADNLKANLALIVPREDADLIRKLLKSSKLWNGIVKPNTMEDGRLALPVSNRISSILKQHADNAEYQELVKTLSCVHYTLQHVDLPLSKQVKRSTPQIQLRKAVKELFMSECCAEDWSEELEQEIPNKWERHGHLIVLPDKAFSSQIWNKLGRGLWQCVCDALHASGVARQGSNRGDAFRSPGLQLLLGEDAWVTHTDNGIRYSFDVTRCMFSAGNITEKLRVAKFNCQGETVVDMYAGIGYFSLPYLVHAGASYLHACEWNPAAVEALTHNLNSNGVSHRATVHHGDNTQVCPAGVGDRVNLGLIPCSCAGWRTACRALKPTTGGRMHVHHNVYSTHKQGNMQYYSEHNIGIECSVGYVTDTLYTSNEVEESSRIMCDSTDTSVESNYLETDSDQQCYFSQSQISAAENISRICTQPTLVNDAHACDASSVESASWLVSSGDDSDVFSECGDVVSAWRPEWRVWCRRAAHIMKGLLQETHGAPWGVRVLHLEHVKSYAPHVDHMVLDLKCWPLG